MAILFGLIGLVLMLAVCVGVIFLIIFLARKLGLIGKGDHTENGLLNGRSINFKSIGNSINVRIVVVVILIVLMTIPLGMVKDVVSERSLLYWSVQDDIAETWGHQQHLRGAVLLIPYTEKFETVEIITKEDGSEQQKNKVTFKHRTAIVLPDELHINVKLQSDTRKRSIYETLVYTADLAINGKLSKPEITPLSNHIDKIHWEQAWLALGLSDTQAINHVSKLDWNNKVGHVDFEPGTKITKLIDNGFHAPLNLSDFKQVSRLDSTVPFSLRIDVNGSRGFYFSPFGKVTNVAVNSDWPHPSFQGNVLPDEHNIEQSHFNASWSVPHLARNYPQMWTLEAQTFDIEEFKAGVDLFESVSLYSQVTRAIKYGILFIVLTYITFLLFEMGVGQRLHIVQYGVIGLALSIFYLMLLSMSEHLGFFKAYISAATVIVIMISAYVFLVIRNLSRTVIIASLLAGLYALLYAMLQLEDYALLAGTVLLLVVLGTIMYVTRNFGADKAKKEVIE